MKKYPFESLGKIPAVDECRKYFPRYDQQTFLQQLTYTDQQIIQYFPQRFISQHQQFNKAGQYLKIGFWTMDILFVTFCHKLRLFSKLLGTKTWRMFLFKLSCIFIPFNFIQKIQQDAKIQFYKHLYQGVNKFYKRYKENGDILNLNIMIELENNQNQIEKICKLNEFRLVHGVTDVEIVQNVQNKSKNVV